MEPTIEEPVANTISDGVDNGEGPTIGVSPEAPPNNVPDNSSSSSSISTSPSNHKTYYDEEVASDVNPLYMESLKKIPSLDESALQTNRSIGGHHVQFSRQLSSPSKFKLRRLNMAGIISSAEDTAGPSPPRIFANSWSFGSPEKGMDGVVGSDDDNMDGVVGSDDELIMEFNINNNEPSTTPQERSRKNLPKVKSVEFNLDLIELAPSDDENDKTGQYHKAAKNEEEEEDTSLEQFTDLQTDSEESEDKVDSEYGSASFRKVRETNHCDQHYVYESKEGRPLQFIGLVVLLMITIMFVPFILDSALNPQEDTMEPTSSPSGSLNQTSQFQSFLPSPSPSSFQVPTQSRMPSRSYSPSVLPSTSPSRSPTTSPSISPSIEPTIAPSSIPSMQPSVKPSRVPSSQPTDSPSISPTTPPPTSRPTKSFSPTILSCEVYQRDGCDDYHHPAGWINDFRCTVSNSFLTCSIGSCFNIRPGDWPSWELFLTNAERNYFRIQHNGAQTSVVLQEQNAFDGSWTVRQSYSVKPSASELVFGIPIGHIPDVERLRVWLVSYNEYGMDVDRIPKVGSLVFTGAGDICS